MDKLASFNNIQDCIFTVRGLQVMLDSDLAIMYQVETRVLNQAVTRNIERFPKDFMFQLDDKEWSNLKSQNVTSSWGGRRKLPFVFTEQGISTLSGVLKSDIAVKVNIAIMRTFVEMRKFVSNNAAVFQRLDRLEQKQLKTDEKVDKVFSALEERQLSPQQGIFFDGQIFDAYTLMADIVRQAEKEIILIDNYVDDSVLTLFSKRKKGVKCAIYTKNISKQLKLDVAKFNEQYGELALHQFSKAHDRFLIVDSEAVYHIGASLKDLGKKPVLSDSRSMVCLY